MKMEEQIKHFFSPQEAGEKALEAVKYLREKTAPKLLAGGFDLNIEWEDVSGFVYKWDCARLHVTIVSYEDAKEIDRVGEFYINCHSVAEWEARMKLILIITEVSGKNPCQMVKLLSDLY